MEGQLRAFFGGFAARFSLPLLLERKERLRGQQQTGGPRDAWLHRVPTGAANLGPSTGPTLRKKPPAAWHRWDATELARSFGSLIPVDRVIFL